MASGAVLIHQKPALEARIKTLLNQDLKEICKAFSYPVSGTKAVLQKRCIDILDHIVRTNNNTNFDDFARRVGHRGAAPRHTQPGYTGGSFQTIVTAPGGNKSLPASRLPAGGNYFKASPFYEVREAVLHLQDLPEMPQNRNTVRTTIKLPDAVAQQLKNDKSMRLLMYCGLTQGMAPYSPVDVSFPNQLEVKINDDDVKHNFKGLKNKPGSTKPADITDKCRLIAGYNNQVAVTYALTTKRYAYGVHLARYVSADKLVEQIKTNNLIPKERVLEEMNKANADPDIAATSFRMSLKDPVSTVRITLPVRSTICSHNQCFDGMMFLQLQEQAPQWQCPHCSKGITFASLCVDKYFEDILEKTPKSVEKVDIEPNGEWKIIKEEEDGQANGKSSQPRASYDQDDDDDDDLIEITEAPRHANGVSRNSMSQGNHMSPAFPSPFPMNTPPVSSREPSVAQPTSATSAAPPQSNKRPAGAVIDLTLSDDDEPPRPAKRTAPPVRPSNPTSTPSYNNSASMTERAPAPAPLPAPQPPSRPPVDGYRPSYSNMPRPQSVSSNNTFGAANTIESPRSPVQATHSPYATFGFGQQQHSLPPPSQSPTMAGGSFSYRPASAGGAHMGQGQQPHPPQPQPMPSPQHPGIRLPPIQSATSSAQQNGWRGESYPFSSSNSPPG